MTKVNYKAGPVGFESMIIMGTVALLILVAGINLVNHLY